MAKFINIDDVLFDNVQLNKENNLKLSNHMKTVGHHKRTHSKSTEHIDFYDKFEFTASRKGFRDLHKQ